MHEHKQLIHDEGVAALRRLFLVAQSDSGQCRFIARFLLGLYNGTRFPFDLTDFRVIDEQLFNDCMLVLRMDARITQKEVHCYFDRGGEMFEELVQRWNVEDILVLRRAVQTGVRTVIEHVSESIGDHAQVNVLSYSTAPGYRDIKVAVKLMPCDGKPVDVELSIDRKSTAVLLEAIFDAYRSAWWPGRPIDADPNETRPQWITALV